jgi:hypothetical protein
MELAILIILILILIVEAAGFVITLANVGNVFSILQNNKQILNGLQVVAQTTAATAMSNQESLEIFRGRVK